MHHLDNKIHFMGENKIKKNVSKDKFEFIPANEVNMQLNQYHHLLAKQ